MGELGTIFGGILDVGLAPVLVILLLVKGFDLLNKFQKRMYKLELGQQLILAKLDATEEYNEAIKQLKERESDE